MSTEIVEWICFGVDAGLALLFYGLHRYHNKKLAHIEKAEIVKLDADLKNRILTGGETLDYACVDGYVASDVPSLRSSYNRTKGVIKRTELVEHLAKRENGIWRDIKRNIGTSTIDKVAFYLKGTRESSNVQIDVTEPLNAHYIVGELSETYSKFEPNQDGVLTGVLNRLSGDISKGVHTSEEMLPLGTYLLGIGRITAENGRLTIEPPTNGAPYILTRQSIKELQKSLSSLSRVFKIFLYIFGAIGAGIIGVKLYRYLKQYHDYQTFQQLRRDVQNRGNRLGGNGNDVGGANENAANQNVDDATVQGRDYDGRTCVVCLANQRNVVILNCGHVCCCVDCAEALPLPRKCPVCRQHVIRVVPLYNA